MINNNDNNNDLKKMVLSCIAVASLVLLCFLAFIYSSDNKKPKTVPVLNKPEEEVTTEEELVYGKSNFTSGDLDFWNMNEGKYKPAVADKHTDYPDNTDGNTSSLPDPKKKNNKKDSDGIADATMNSVDEEDDDTESLENNISSENKVKVEMENGDTEYFEINDKLNKNSYDFKKYLSNTEKGYFYSDGTCKIGIDISKYQGTIDFSKVKSSGVDFVMIRVGARGYSSGDVFLDEKFVEYAANAKMNLLPIGSYFYSMATTDVEAVEEANYAVAACANYGLTYPIALDMETVPNEPYRTQNLTNKERTLIAKTFCDTVKSFGYKPVIYASKEYLLTKLYLDELMDYDVWLCDPVTENVELKAPVIKTGADDDGKKLDEDKKNNPEKIVSTEEHSDEIEALSTNYPYWFSMWQYSHKGKVDGIEGPVDINICFTDYNEH